MIPHVRVTATAVALKLFQDGRKCEVMDCSTDGIVSKSVSKKNSYLIENIFRLIGALCEFDARHRLNCPVGQFNIKLLLFRMLFAHLIDDGFIWPPIFCVNQAGS